MTFHEICIVVELGHMKIGFLLMPKSFVFFRGPKVLAQNKFTPVYKHNKMPVELRKYNI